MKKLFFLMFVCIFSSCKKNTVEKTISTDKDWVLSTAIISPAKIVNGIPQTDFIAISGPGSCLQNNYSISFFENGTYGISSTGALCDMIAYTDEHKWFKDGNKVTLVINNDSLEATVEGNKLKYSSRYSTNGVDYIVAYTFAKNRNNPISRF